MSKYNYVDLNSSKMLTNVNSLNIGMESDELFINNQLNFTKNININTINNKNILLPRKPEIYDANKLVLTNSTYNDFEYLQFNNRIIQTQFTQYRTDFISSGTGWKPLPFSVTITPKNIHSQILISTAVYYGGSNTSADFGFRLYKKVGSGSFAVIPLSQNIDNDNKGSGVFMSNNSGVDNDNYYQYQTACVTNEFLDYPHTTDTIEYKLFCSPDLSDSNNTDVFYINRPATSTDNNKLHSSSYIKAQEIEIYKYTDYEAPIVTEYFMNNQLYKIFTFLKNGKLVLPKDTICDYLIIAGGGGGGSSTNSSSIEGGGGGAGGLIYRENISLTTGTYNIKVGDGGDAETNGEDSYIESELVPLVGYGVANNNLNAYTSSFSSNPNNTYDNYIHDDGSIPIAQFTSWVSGAYIQYDFGSNTPVRVIHYKIFSLGGNENAMPSSWTFQARNSTSDSWVILDTQKNITDWDDETIMHNQNINATNNKASSNPNCAKSYNVSNINKYRYYKIVFTANGGHGTSLWINELALFGGSDSLFEGAKGGGGSSNIGNGNSGGSGSGGKQPNNSIGGNAISYNNGSVSTNQGYSQGINQVGIFGNQGGSGTAIFSDYFTENTLSTYTIDGRPGWTHTETHNSSDNTITIITADNSFSSLDYKFTNTPITSGIIRIRLMKTRDYPADNLNYIYMYNSSDGIHTGYDPNDRNISGDNHYVANITGSAYSTIIGKRYGGIDDVDNTLTYDFDIEDQYFIFELIFNPISIELRVDGVSKGIHNFSNKDILPIDSFQLRNDQFDGKLDFIEINNTSGGGGGAGAPGNNGGDSSNFGHGGIGKRYNIRDGKTAVYYAGGGAAGRTSLIGIRSGGGLGGGGDGAPYSYTPLTDANHGGNGKANTGGGGGGSYSTHTDAYRGGKGGSGIVIVRVPQNLKNTLYIPKATGGIISYYTLGNINYCVHTFLDSGSFIPESSLQVDYLIVAGGGSGGSGGSLANEGAGGGAGGLIYQTGITFTNSTYNIIIGKGGSENSNGENSSITGTGLTSNRIALGGGKGGHGNYPNQYSYNSQNTENGGSGGGISLSGLFNDSNFKFLWRAGETSTIMNQYTVSEYGNISVLQDSDGYNYVSPQANQYFKITGSTSDALLARHQKNITFAYAIDFNQTTSTEYRHLFYQTDTESTTIGDKRNHEFILVTNTGEIRYDNYDPHGGGWGSGVSGNSMSTGKHVIVVTLTSTTISIYRDGLRVVYITSGKSGENYSHGQPDRIIIGGAPWNLTRNFGNDKLYSIAVWDRVLSENEVQNITFDVLVKTNNSSAIVTSGDTLIEMSTIPNEVGVFGNDGGKFLQNPNNTGGGGGGAGGPGQNGSLQIGSSNLSGSGFGGVGKQYSIRTGSLEYYAGGGGASSGNNVNAIGAPGGLGGGGKGGGGSRINQGTGNLIGEDGKPNTGGGGGGTLSSRSVKGGDGGSGIVVIRYQL